MTFLKISLSKDILENIVQYGHSWKDILDKNALFDSISTLLLRIPISKILIRHGAVKCFFLLSFCKYGRAARWSMNVHGETRQGWSNFQIWAIWPFAPFSEPTAHFPWDSSDRHQWSMWGRLLRPIKTLIPYSYLHYTHIWLCLLLINTVCMCYVILSTWESTGRGKTSQGGSYTIHCAVCVKCSVQCVMWRGKSSCLTCVEIVCCLCVGCV